MDPGKDMSHGASLAETWTWLPTTSLPPQIRTALNIVDS